MVTGPQPPLIVSTIQSGSDPTNDIPDPKYGPNGTQSTLASNNIENYTARGKMDDSGGRDSLAPTRPGSGISNGAKTKHQWTNLDRTTLHI